MESEKKLSGAFVGLIVIVIILVIGGIYIWQSNQNAPEVMNESGAGSEDSEELNSIEADLNGTDTNTGVDANTVY